MSETESGVGGVDGDRTFTRREWLTRRAIMNGAPPMMAQEAVSSVAMGHDDWDMDERKPLAEWDMMEHPQ